MVVLSSNKNQPCPSRSHLSIIITVSESRTNSGSSLLIQISFMHRYRPQLRSDQFRVVPAYPDIICRSIIFVMSSRSESRTKSVSSALPGIMLHHGRLWIQDQISVISAHPGSSKHPCRLWASPEPFLGHPCLSRYHLVINVNNSQLSIHSCHI